MKFVIALSVLLILGSTTGLEQDVAQENQGKRVVLKRIVKRSLGTLGTQMLPRLQAKIADQCINRGAGKELQDAFDDMKTCVGSKQIIRTPKEQYLENLERCSQDVVVKTRNCLPNDKKYFPEFILSLAKSVVNFMYDDVDLLRLDLAACLPSLNNYVAQRKYVQCLSDTSTQTRDTDELPTSKAEFCHKFIPATYCFTDMLKDNCVQTPNMIRFTEDYINAMKRPCDQKEI